MAYIRQLFSGGAVLTADQMNQVEENIDTHVHRLIPQLAKNVSYTLASGDGGYHLYHNIASIHGYTIPAATVQSFEIGTVITFVNANSAGNLYVGINSDTLRRVGTTDVGTRTIAPNGMATILKVGETQWYINGTGLT